METGTTGHGVERTQSYRLNNLSPGQPLQITVVYYSDLAATVYFDKSTDWIAGTTYEFIVDNNIKNAPPCSVTQNVNVRIEFTTSSSGISSPKNDKVIISPTHLPIISPTIPETSSEFPEIIETPAITETSSAIITPEPTGTIWVTPQLPESTPGTSIHTTGLPKIMITRPPMPDKPVQDSSILDIDENILSVILITLSMSILLNSH